MLLIGKLSWLKVSRFYIILLYRLFTMCNGSSTLRLLYQTGKMYLVLNIYFLEYVYAMRARCSL